MAPEFRQHQSKEMRDWIREAKKHGLDSSPRTFAELTAEPTWSASTIPIEGALQFHTLHRGWDDLDETIPRLQAAGIISADDIDLSEKLLRAAEGASHLDFVLDAFCQAESNMLDPFSTACSVRHSSPFGVASHLWTIYQNLRPQGGATAEDDDCVSSLVGVSKKRSTRFPAQGHIPRLDFHSTEAISSPILHAETGTSPLTARFSTLDMRQTSPTRSRLPSRAMTTGEDPPPQSSQATSRIPTVDGKPLHPGKVTAAITKKPPAIPVQSTQSGALPRSLDRGLPPLPRKTDYEIQSSDFCFSYLDFLVTHGFTAEARDIIQPLPQDKGYHFGRSHNGSPLFEARPSGVVLRRDGTGEKVPRIWVKVKRTRRPKDVGGQLRREEAAQFAALVYENWRQGVSPWGDIPGSSEDKPDPPFVNFGRVSPSPTDESGQGGVRRSLEIAFNHDAFYLIVISFNRRFEEYLTNMQSVTYDETIQEDDFAVFEEHGPFTLGKKDEMKLFNRTFLALVAAHLRESSSGRGLVGRLKADLEGLYAQPSPSEMDDLRAIIATYSLEKHQGTPEGRAALRRMQPMSVFPGTSP